MKIIEKLMEYMIGSLLIILTILVLFLIGCVPYMLHVDSECLKAGYPDSKVDIYFNAYCVNLEGVVTNKVIQLKD